MDTELLFYQDQYESEFDAIVLACEKTEKGYKAEIDRTCFFPEEGGQYPDEGTIDGINVTYVEIENGSVFHYLESPLEVGKLVHGKINFEKRFDRMQNHTGEHILCGLIHKMKGYENVGFHLSDEIMTMDISGIMSQKEIEKVEYLANQVVWKNEEVKAFYPDSDEIKNIEYRAKSEIKGKIRLVQIGDADICACCAPHVNRTGEIGAIKILKAVKYKGGMRFNVACGKRAFEDSRARYDETEAISEMLSVKPLEVVPAVETLNKKLMMSKSETKAVRRLLIEAKVQALDNKEGNICMKFQDAENDDLRYAVNLGMLKCSGTFFAYTGTGENGFSFVMGRRNGDFTDDLKEILNGIGGRGGGRGNVIAGVANATEVSIIYYFEG